MSNFLSDVRYALRQLRRAPGFTIMAVLVMALGIGSNVTLFAVVHSVLLKPLPFQDPERLLMLYEHSGVGGEQFAYNNVAGGIFSAWKQQNSSFSDLALLQYNEVGLSGTNGELPETLRSARIAWNMFPALGVQPAFGRNFSATEDSPNANGTVILSWSLWKRRFGGDPNILNRRISLDAKPYTVIGIMPQWVQFPENNTQLWTPISHDAPQALLKAIDFHDFRAIGRLKPGVTQAQATADLTVITRRIHDANLSNPFVSPSANSRSLLESIVGNVKRPLYVLLAATACLLLIACLNVANLLVARAAARRKELAIRTALGGGRMRLLRGHLAESFLLSIAGGLAGVTLTYGAIVWLANTRTDMARMGAVQIDWVVAVFTIGVVVMCALFSGIVSALNAKDTQVLVALHESSRSHSASGSRARLRKVLLAAEVGLTVILLVAASLLVKSYERLRSTSVGTLTDNVLTMRLALPEARYKTPGVASASFFEQMLEKVRALPGVEAAGVASSVPGQGYSGDRSFVIVEHPPLPQGKGLFAINQWTDPGYFAAMGIPILHGHTFDDGQKLDRANEVIINESFAEKFFAGEDPIGKHLHFGDQSKPSVIVGIVGDTRYQIGLPPQPIQYYPLFSGDQGEGTLVIRSDRNVEQLALPVQRVIQSMDPDLPVSDVLTMDQLLGKSTLDQSFNTTLLTGFAILSLVLAAVGLFGVLSYIAAQRTNEIGIRIALGAQREQVLRLMLVDGLQPAFIGLVFGLAASAAIGRLIHAMLYETQPLDPYVFAAVTAMLLAVAALACIAPAWRASRLDPVQALRTE